MKNIDIVDTFKELNKIDKDTLKESFTDESGEKCFRFSDVHDLFNEIFKDDKESRDRWNSYVN